MAFTELPLFHRKLNLDQRADVILCAQNHKNGEQIEDNCRNCGACCIALEIKSLRKKAGEVCPNLLITRNGVTCRIYNSPNRPQECRGYDCRNETYENIRYPNGNGNRRVIELYSAKRFIEQMQETPKAVF